MTELRTIRRIPTTTKLAYGKNVVDSRRSRLQPASLCRSCPNCETWVVNLSDHLRKTHRIASPVDRKPLLRMARLEKRRMTETANHSSTTTILKAAPQSTSLMTNGGMSGSHGNTNEIENLLFKQEHDADPLSNEQYSVAIPENILLNQQMTNSLAHYSATVKRQHSDDEHASNRPLSPNKKARLGTLDGTKMASSTHPSGAKPTKKNRNKQQQQQQQTIIKTAASGVFPQQQQQQQAPQPTMTIQNMNQTSDDVSTGNEWKRFNHSKALLSLSLLCSSPKSCR